MYYYIDGYNLIFSLVDSKESLQSLRQKTVLFLQKKFASFHLTGTLVFDGAHRRGEESGLSYPSPLIVAYTPKDQNADSYIVEQIEKTPQKGQITVITNDRGLILHTHSLGAHTQSNQAFIQWLKQKGKKKRLKKGKDPIETPENQERLLKIFEDRLQKKSDPFSEDNFF